jgi:ribose-phosphate pyrophosphokinase
MKKDVEARLSLISGTAHRTLAKEISEYLEIPLSPIELATFANGEIDCKIGESVRGSDLFVIQTHHGSVNDALMEQAIIIDAAKRASARSITAVCPLLGYSRQDRKASGREPITARLVVDILAAAGADRIMSVDLHSGQTQGFFNGPFDHLIAMPALRHYVHENLDLENLVIVAPDAGGVKSAERSSVALGCDIAIVHKQRSKSVRNQVEANYLIGEVKGKNCIIVDDMIDTAGTLCAAAELLKKHGAQDIYGLATHGIFSPPALKRIESSPILKVVITNTVPLPLTHPKIETVSIAPLIAEAIEAVFAGLSLSALFDGQNQK